MEEPLQDAGGRARGAGLGRAGHAGGGPVRGLLGPVVGLYDLNPVNPSMRVKAPGFNP